MGTMININGRMVDTANKKQLAREKEIRAKKLTQAPAEDKVED